LREWGNSREVVVRSEMALCVLAQSPALHIGLTIFLLETARRTGGASVLTAGDELMDWRTDELTSGRAARL